MGQGTNKAKSNDQTDVGIEDKQGKSGATNTDTQAEQAGARPANPLPEEKQPRPGLEADMEHRPQYIAPDYKGAEKLAGKVALITGGDSGIGRSVAVLYAREGADVAIVYTPAEEVDAAETAAQVEREGQKCLRIPGDLKDPEFCREAVERTNSEFGHLDILVNNAAFQHHQKSLEDISDEQFDETFKTNIYGYFRMTKAALKYLPEGGAIVNCGSITGLEGNKELIDYAATKGAIHAFTKSLAQNLAERKIRVNCVSPGPIWTPLNVADKEPEEVSNHGADTPMKRPGQPEEVAPAFVFFASNVDSSYISGEVFTILGGETRAA
jgi:NAD(P)-dependent dehydrogenase (short-subunit alcohol dehydrogenase family)